MLVIGTGLTGLPELAKVLHDIPADVADRHPAFLGDVSDHLHQLLAPLLAQLRD